VELRAQILPLIEGFSAYLIAYQKQFQEVGNDRFFEAWSHSNQQKVDWTVEPITHMGNSSYLFGRNRT